uniref:Uncharacterized protein n=1 Tax=viral metagenome TaxID=1070528 RepID=A0A6C0APL3_9ZZZZ
MPCPYANALGIPGQGVHAQRFMGLALNDTIATVVAALLTAWLFNISFLYSMIGWFVGGEVLHYAFGVNTAFLKMIGITPCKT